MCSTQRASMLLKPSAIHTPFNPIGTAINLPFGQAQDAPPPSFAPPLPLWHGDTSFQCAPRDISNQSNNYRHPHPLASMLFQAALQQAGALCMLEQLLTHIASMNRVNSSTLQRWPHINQCICHHTGNRLTNNKSCPWLHPRQLNGLAAAHSSSST